MKMFCRYLDNIMRNINKLTHYNNNPYCFFMNYSFAGAVDCGSGRSSIGGDYTASPVNITAPNNGETHILLWSVNNSVIDTAYSNRAKYQPILWINTAQTIIDIPP